MSAAKAPAKATAKAKTVKTYTSTRTVFRPTDPNPKGNCVLIKPGGRFQVYEGFPVPDYWTEVKAPKKDDE
jgi:hypothetical protein